MRAWIGWLVVVVVSVSATSSFAADTGNLRGYLGLRGGGYPIFTHTDEDPLLHLEHNSEATFGAVLGFNFDKHWGSSSPASARSRDSRTRRRTTAPRSIPGGHCSGSSAGATRSWTTC